MTSFSVAARHGRYIETTKGHAIMELELLRQIEAFTAGRTVTETILIIAIVALVVTIIYFGRNLGSQNTVLASIIKILGSTTNGFASVEASMKHSADSIRILAEQIRENSAAIQAHSDALVAHSDAVTTLTNNQEALHKAATLQRTRLDRLSSNLDALTVNVETVAKNWAQASAALDKVLGLMQQQNLATAEVTDRLDDIDSTQVKQATIIGSQIQELRTSVLDYITKLIEKQIEEAKQDEESNAS